MAFRVSLGRSLVVAGLLAGTAVSLAGGGAYAASPATHAPASAHRVEAHRVEAHRVEAHRVEAHRAGAHHAGAHHKTTMLTTRVAMVHIRSRAKISKGSKILVTLPRSGMTVAVRCHKISTSVGGDPTWYRVVAPRAGFVAGHELNISREPAAGVMACKAKKK